MDKRLIYIALLVFIALLPSINANNATYCQGVDNIIWCDDFDIVTDWTIFQGTVAVVNYDGDNRIKNTNGAAATFYLNNDLSLPNSEISVRFLFRDNSNNYGYMFFAPNGGMGTFNGYGAYWVTDTAGDDFTSRVEGVAQTEDTDIVTNKWYEFCFSLNPTFMESYINGSLIHNQTGFARSVSDSVDNGFRFDALSMYYDELIIYEGNCSDIPIINRSAAPIVTIVYPAENGKYNATTTFNGTIVLSTDITSDCVINYSNSKISNLTSHTFTLTDTDDGNYTVSYECNHSTSTTNSSFWFFKDETYPNSELKIPQDHAVYDSDIYINITFNDTYLFGVNVTITNASGDGAIYYAYSSGDITNGSTGINVYDFFNITQFQYNTTLQLFREAVDSHTAREFKEDLKAIKDLDNPEYNELVYDLSRGDITLEYPKDLDILTTKETDRFVLTLYSETIRGETAFNIQAPKMVYLPNSGYQGHFVIFDKDDKPAYWFDTEGLDQTYIEFVKPNKYRIHYIQHKDYEVTRSLGGVNYINWTTTFSIENKTPVVTSSSTIEAVSGFYEMDCSGYTYLKDDVFFNYQVFHGGVLNYSHIMNVSNDGITDYYNYSVGGYDFANPENAFDSDLNSYATGSDDIIYFNVSKHLKTTNITQIQLNISAYISSPGIPSATLAVYCVYEPDWITGFTEILYTTFPQDIKSNFIANITSEACFNYSSDWFIIMIRNENVDDLRLYNINHTIETPEIRYFANNISANVFNDTDPTRGDYVFSCQASDGYINGLWLNSSIYSAGYIKANFFDEHSLNPFNYSTVTAALVGLNVNYSEEKTTTNGSIRFDNFTLGYLYDLRYSAPGHTIRSRYIDYTIFGNKTPDCYLLNDTISDKLDVTVRDFSLIGIPNVTVRIQRYYPNITTWLTVAEGLTNIQGTRRFYVEKEDVFYRFIILYEGSTIFTTSGEIIDSDTTTYRITTDISSAYTEYAYLDGQISYSNATGTPTFTTIYEDADESINSVTLEVYQRQDDYTYTLYEDNTSYASDDTITVVINLSDIYDYYYAVTKITFEDGGNTYLDDYAEFSPPPPAEKEDFRPFIIIVYIILFPALILGALFVSRRLIAVPIAVDVCVLIAHYNPLWELIPFWSLMIVLVGSVPISYYLNKINV